MKAHRISALLILLVVLIIPSVSFTEQDSVDYPGVSTGRDLFELMKLYETGSNERSAHSMEIGYLYGYLDGFWDALWIEELKVISTKTRLYKVIKLPKLREDEDDVGLLVEVFRKWAEAHPERLDNHASLCLMDSLYDAYGRTNE